MAVDAYYLPRRASSLHKTVRTSVTNWHTSVSLDRLGPRIEHMDFVLFNETARALCVSWRHNPELANGGWWKFTVKLIGADVKLPSPERLITFVNLDQSATSKPLPKANAC